MTDRKTFLAILSLTLVISSCFHTSRVTQRYNYGAQMKFTDVVLFTGYGGQASFTSEQMLRDTQKLLGKCGIKVIYQHDNGLNYEFMKAGFSATPADLDNDEFIDRIKQVFGVTHLFSVGHLSQYNGQTMPVSKGEALYDESGLVFEIYSLANEQVISSMKMSGNTFHLISINEPEDRNYGNIYKNYRKALRKLMDTAICN